MKYLILVWILSAVIFLSLTDPEPAQRDPVPEEIIVAHSAHCAGCHGYDPSGRALVDSEGNDVSIYTDAKVSMMGLSAHDPFWRATLKHEVSLFPEEQSEIEIACLKCHAPLGSQQSSYDGGVYSYEAMLDDTLGLDGVSCSACHQQSPETYGRSHSGNFSLNTERLLYGPHPEPFKGPMELYVGFTPVFTDLIYSSGICAGCHTLITPTLGLDGLPTGDMFVEQATYHEWLNSSYPIQGIECQTCHMPLLNDSVFIATELKGLDKRHPFGLHQFYGANTAMLSMMYAHRDSLGLANIAQADAWSESIQNNRTALHNAGDVLVTNYHVFGDTLYTEVTVQNRSGHKLPSGYPSRITWLQVILTDILTSDTIYANGLMDNAGKITGRDTPYEPHHEVSHSHDDVQIYEMVMSDEQGHVTTRLNAAQIPAKDNRLLPEGFDRNHPVYDTVAVRGEAIADPDYSTLSMLGRDILEYRIPITGRTGPASLKVALRYHTFPARWMHDLFQNDGIDEVRRFKDMYNGYERFTELIDSIEILNIDLAPSYVEDENTSSFIVFPNPIEDRRIHVISTISGTYLYELWNMSGLLQQEGDLADEIQLLPGIRPGLHVLVVKGNGLRDVYWIFVPD